MADPVSIALSGLNAATLRAGAAASNIANARTVGALAPSDGPEAYAPVDVVATSQGDAGIDAKLEARTPATYTAYDPNAAYANSDGLIAVPNVDEATEIVNLKQAALAYKANAAVIKVTDDMQRELLDRIDERA